MSRLEELIEELCPNGVEYKTLGEMGDFYSGLTGKSKKDFTNGNSKFITYMNVYKNPALSLETTETVNIGASEKQNAVLYGDVLFTGSSETPDECGISSVLTQRTNEKLYLNSFCMGYRFFDGCLFLPDFLKHLFRSSEIRAQIGKTASGVTRFNVSKDKMRKVIIPVPPLPVQREIVRILDNFTELTAKLTAELTAREKQYDYYKNFIVENSKSKSNVVKLGDIASFSQGIQIEPQKQYATMKEGYIRFLRIVDFVNDNEPPRYIEMPDKKYTKQENELIMIRYGANAAGKVFLNHTGAIANNIFKINITRKDVNIKYLRHYLSQKYVYEYLNSAGGKSTMPAVNFKMVSKIDIYLPSISEQQRIVSILDRFDSLCNDITSGLPAEIAARQKQYEYYRDKLLTFKAIS